jgi:hypothetical protein
MLADGADPSTIRNNRLMPARTFPCDPDAINADSGVWAWLVLMNADGSDQRLV